MSFDVDANLGKFIDVHGNRVDDPSEDAPVVIVAGLWKWGMPRGVMQSTCSLCKDKVGLDPRSQKLVEQQPCKVVMIFCRECWEGFQLYQAKDRGPKFMRWVDRLAERMAGGNR